jgi:hypothetical protein
VKGQSFGGAMILTAQPKNDAGCSIHENADTGPSLRRDRHTERSVCGLLRVHTLAHPIYPGRVESDGGEHTAGACGEPTQHAMTVFPAGRLDKGWTG